MNKVASNGKSYRLDKELFQKEQEELSRRAWDYEESLDWDLSKYLHEEENENLMLPIIVLGAHKRRCPYCQSSKCCGLGKKVDYFSSRGEILIKPTPVVVSEGKEKRILELTWCSKTKEFFLIESNESLFVDDPGNLRCVTCRSDRLHIVTIGKCAQVSCRNCHSEFSIRGYGFAEIKKIADEINARQANDHVKCSPMT